MRSISFSASLLSVPTPAESGRRARSRKPRMGPRLGAFTSPKDRYPCPDFAPVLCEPHEVDTRRECSAIRGVERVAPGADARASDAVVDLPAPALEAYDFAVGTPPRWAPEHLTWLQAPSGP